MLEKKQTKKIEEILTEIDLEQPAPADERKGFGEADRNSGADWICGRGRRESGRFRNLQYLYGA